MIFIIEPEIDFVTITVMLLGVCIKRNGTAFHQFEDFLLFFCCKILFLLRFQNWNSKKLIRQKKLLSKYIEKLERLCNNHQLQVL